MAILKTVKTNSRRGARALLQLERRGGSVVDRKTLRAAGRIVRDIRDHGDHALLKAVARYDGVEKQRVAQLRLASGSDATSSSSPSTLPAGFERAIERSIAAVTAFHRPQVHQGYVLDRDGVRLEEHRRAYRRVGLYVPGGRFPYPSTVVMSVIPARLAGVEEIVVVTPPRAWQESPALRHTLELLEVDEVWGMGGAHAVAALAHGTETVARVDMIAGPGNAWVAAAKQLVSSFVGVDREAGPSEVVIVADESAPAELVAADLLAQAEHDPNAMAVLVTPDRALAAAVAKEVDRQLSGLATAATARLSLKARGMIFLVEDLEEALVIAERLAPEHLQLIGACAEELSDRVRCAGAVFVGEFTPVVLGDYMVGPSHVLPTGGTARYASGLGVDDFIKRHHVVRLDASASADWSRDAAALATVEGLEAHAQSARLRVPADGELLSTELTKGKSS
jgi:histidinol dehydrogenase